MKDKEANAWKEKNWHLKRNLLYGAVFGLSAAIGIGIAITV